MNNSLKEYEDYVFIGNFKKVYQYIPKSFLKQLEKQQ